MSVCCCGLTEWRVYRDWIAIVDACDASLLDLGWHVQTRGRHRLPACMATKTEGRTIRLHREIMKAASGVVVDHINGNPLDNRRQNLRLANTASNNRNRRVQSGSYTGFKGVHLHRPGWWRAAIVANGKKHDLGVFRSPVEAARAYDTAAVALHGQFARTNAKMGMLQHGKQTKLFRGTQAHFVNLPCAEENSGKE